MVLLYESQGESMVTRRHNYHTVKKLKAITKHSLTARDCPGAGECDCRESVDRSLRLRPTRPTGTPCACVCAQLVEHEKCLQV